MIYTIAHNKGGVGKTTLTLNLAAAMRPDSIIDLDTHQSLAILNQLRPEASRLPVHLCNTRQELVAQLRQSERGSTILVDCGGFDSDLTRMAVAAADVVLVPVKDDLPELIGLRRFDDVLSELSQEMEQHIHGHVLFNRIHPSRTRFDDVERFLSEARHLGRLNSTIAARKAYPSALAKGLGVTEDRASRYGDAGQEMRRLVSELEGLKNTL
jgi:chromosome partitioning protein